MAQLLEENLLVSDVSSDVALFSRFWVVKSFREFQLKNSRFGFKKFGFVKMGVSKNREIPQNG